MRKSLPMLALLGLYVCSGTAFALSTMPNGEGNPYPSLFALLSLVGVLGLCFWIVDRLEKRMVERLKRENNVQGLIEALKNGWLSRKAACALGDMKAGEAVGPLVEALGDTNSDVRQAAAKALGDIGDPRAAGPLRLALSDSYAGVRECASSSLKRLQNTGNAL